MQNLLVINCGLPPCRAATASFGLKTFGVGRAPKADTLRLRVAKADGLATS